MGLRFGPPIEQPPIVVEEGEPYPIEAERVISSDLAAEVPTWITVTPTAIASRAIHALLAAGWTLSAPARTASTERED